MIQPLSDREVHPSTITDNALGREPYYESIRQAGFRAGVQAAIDLLKFYNQNKGMRKDDVLNALIDMREKGVG